MTTVFTSGWSRLISATHSRPPLPGMFRSSSTTSGLRRPTSASSSSPLRASPTTSMSSLPSSARRIPCRISGWSSAIRTFSGVSMPSFLPVPWGAQGDELSLRAPTVHTYPRSVEARRILLVRVRLPGGRRPPRLLRQGRDRERGPRRGLEHLGRLLERAGIQLDQKVDDDARVVLVLVEAHMREELADAVIAEGGVGQRVAGLGPRAALDLVRFHGHRA